MQRENISFLEIKLNKFSFGTQMTNNCTPHYTQTIALHAPIKNWQ